MDGSYVDNIVKKPGSFHILGANLVNASFEIVPKSQAVGTNFSVYAPEASQLFLCLFLKENIESALAMYSSDIGVWHLFIADVGSGMHYGFRAEGNWSCNSLPKFNYKKLLLDPYAREVRGDIKWNEAIFDYQVVDDQWVESELDSADYVPRSVVRDTFFDWEGTRKPNIMHSESIIYELHVKGFTYKHPCVPDDIKGTYLGLCHPSSIKYLKTIGVTTVELMPITSFISEERLSNMGLTNYWGYNPLCLMAPEPSYSIEDPVTELKTMIRELHKAGIEVIIDVVFNHTCESGYGGPSISLRGLSESDYYLMDHHHGQLSSVNMTGCGNTLNFDCTQTLKLTMDALRVWAIEYQVDGFRFDLAPVMARRHRQFHSDSAFFQAIYQDPILSRCKMIAEPWDLGPGGYRLSGFPGMWQEWNDRFRDDARAYWRGDNGHLAAIGWRMTSSEDIFGEKRPLASINYICSHDGFTLRDLVSYEKRHNLANGENNRDGHEHNYAGNFGVEGDTHDLVVNALRLQIKKNLLATLLLSRGIPMLMAGDEFGNSQQGNNNAYCQDNPISWLDWSWLNQEDGEGFELHAFVKKIISLRRQHPLLGGKGGKIGCTWLSSQGEIISDKDLGCLNGGCLGITWASSNKKHRLFILINNGSSGEEFIFNKMGEVGGIWSCLLDTSKDGHSSEQMDTELGRYNISATSMVLIELKHEMC